MKTLYASLMLVSLACSKQEPPPAPVEPAPTPSAVTTAPPPAVPTGTAELGATASNTGDLPTEEDFEEEAATDISAATLDSQLDALEKEIQAE